MWFNRHRTICILISVCVSTAAFSSYAAAPKEIESGKVDQRVAVTSLVKFEDKMCLEFHPVAVRCMKFKESADRMIEEVQETQALQQKADTELLASIIFCEAGNQSFEGQVAVGAVVLNRMNSDQFPDSMEEVIYQPGQFGPVSTGWLDRVRRTSGYTDSALEAAKAALDGENPVGNCLYFDQGGSGKQIGAHYFH